MKSKIFKEDIVKNKKRKFGACAKYHPCLMVHEDGEEVPMLFTSNQLKVAQRRATKNPEDIPEAEGMTFWDWLLG